MEKLFKFRLPLKSGIMLILSFIACQNIFCQESVPYRWKNVQMVGAGFVDGIVFHPSEKGVCYCRTDMGGAYRRNPRTLRWEPLLDWLSYDDVNLMGVESIALDPSDPDRLYLACGTYTNPRTPDGAILRSGDRGQTFQRTDVPFKMGGNEDGRGNGERLAVDPNDGNILYMGTRNSGLWKSHDRSVTWKKVVSFPDISETAPVPDRSRDTLRRWPRSDAGCGIVFILFDPASGSPGKGSLTVYAGVSLINRENLFRSTDGGNNFTSQKLNLPGNLPKQGENRGESRGGQDWIYAAPGREGDLWIAAFDGLYHSTDAGVNFVKMTGAGQIHGFGFGKGAPGSSYNALYLIGSVNGIRGIFRSNDTARSWVRINDDLHQWGLLLHITGDPKKYGRVYVGTHGRGTVYGDPVNKKT